MVLLAGLAASSDAPGRAPAARPFGPLSSRRSGSVPPGPRKTFLSTGPGGLSRPPGLISFYCGVVAAGVCGGAEGAPGGGVGGSRRTVGRWNTDGWGARAGAAVDPNRPLWTSRPAPRDSARTAPSELNLHTMATITPTRSAFLHGQWTADDSARLYGIAD